MRSFVLCVILCTQLTWAIRSGLSTTHGERSHSPLSGDPPKREQGDDCKPFIASSWYAGWQSSDFPPSDISWDKYTWVIYAFATTTPDVNTLGLKESDKWLLPQFVQLAKQHNVHPLLSIGGWAGSQYFSSAVATEANRTAFARAVMNAVHQYDLDGVEIDWEIPGTQGIGCDINSPNDTANLLSFLQTLRHMSGPNLIITAAVVLTTFVGPDGKPLTDVTGFGQVLDYIEILNYDMSNYYTYRTHSYSVGPSSPLDDSYAATPGGSAMSTVQAWSNAGFPLEKMILGVAGYGFSYHVNSSLAYDASGKIHPYVPFDRALQPAGDKWDSKATGVDVCGNSTVPEGAFNFWGLIDAGFLNADGTVAQGIDHVFDQCSQTPFVYNKKTEVMVSYDDAASFTAKGNYIRSSGLAGFSMWETQSDSHDILLDAINSAVGNTY